GNRWCLGTAIKSWLRAAPYPATRKQKDAAPKAMEGLHQKEGGEPMIRAKGNRALGYKALAIWFLVAAVLAALGFVAPALAVGPAKTTLTIRANGVDLSGTVQSSRLSCVDNRNIKL